MNASPALLSYAAHHVLTVKWDLLILFSCHNKYFLSSKSPILGALGDSRLELQGNLKTSIQLKVCIHFLQALIEQADTEKRNRRMSITTRKMLLLQRVQLKIAKIHLEITNIGISVLDLNSFVNGIGYIV